MFTKKLRDLENRQPRFSIPVENDNGTKKRQSLCEHVFQQLNWSK